MATATNTTEGEIVLGGDLTGTADAPELVSTGVIPGVYSPVQRMYVDAKGRTVAVGKLTPAEMSALPLVATTSVKGVFTFDESKITGAGCGVLALNDATSTVKGGFSLGAGLGGTGAVVIDESTLPATGSSRGFVRVGTNVNVSSGVISVSDAGTSTKGVFVLGAGLGTSGGAVVLNESSAPATGAAPGFVLPSTGFTNTSGTISIPDATTSTKGVASFTGSSFSSSSGAVSVDPTALSLTLPAATGAAFGLVRVGTNLSVSGGVLSIPDATTSVKGVASFNSSHFTVATGAVSCPTEARTNVANTYTRSNGGAVQTVSGGSTYTPNFQTGEALADITLNQNLAINFPSTLAPAGTVVRRNIVLRYNAGTAYTVTLSGTYLTNKTLTFTNSASAAVDNLTLICTSTVCYAILNETFL